MTETITEYTVRTALEELAESLSGLRGYVDRAERDGHWVPGTHEFAVRAYPTTSRGGGPWIWDRAGDLDHARLLVEHTSKHCRSLNEPTRQQLGTERVEVVYRWRFELPDGTTITTPWQTYEEER